MSLSKANETRYYPVDRRWFLVGFAALAGCGFQPAYGPNGGASNLINRVAFADPSNKNAFDFVAQLERRLGTAAIPDYKLGYSISVREQLVATTPQQELTRFNVIGTVTYSLKVLPEEEDVLTGSVDTFSSYSVSALDVTSSPPRTSSTIAALAAKRDAYTRLMNSLADGIVTRLAALPVETGR